ncbi:carbohydrate-binding module family 24 protein, partial [Karstenula rhodostoma CBS 690.94]
MRLLAGVLAWALAFAPVVVQAKSVFAHFMVGNTKSFVLNDWVQEIAYAKAARIDAFALNIAYDDYVTQLQLPLAFSAAEAVGFKLFFSFDYAGNGPWPKSEVISMISYYAASSAYFQYNGKPFVSTFEGPERSEDWTDIKASTGCFFIPDWSSLGAKDAWALGTADGLFSWEGWPNGPNNVSTYGDASYFMYLDGAPYMAPISPWFYTNMPGYNKNWLWRGDDMWFDRWQQLIVGELQPEFVQIISWNDYGERQDLRYPFGPEYGKAPYNYVKNMPHDGWRQFLPFVIELWKTGTATVETEGITAWFRPNPATACSDGGTTGNTATQLQLEFQPQEIVQDKVFYSALLGSDATVTVFIGGRSIPGDWSNKPYGNVGVFHGSVNTGGAGGNVIVRITRGGSTVMETSGKGAISAGCANGLTNFNAYVDAGTGGSSGKKTPKAIKDLVPIAGTGVNEFVKLCEFTCKYAYCPEAACTATKFGDAIELPDPTGVIAYPAEGKSAAFGGLCRFACNLGYCPEDLCSLVEKPTYEGDVSPFVQPACTSGTATGDLQGLCSYACNWGFCPIHACTCLSTGPLHLPTPEQEGDIKTAVTTDGSPDYGLCLFACSRGYCPKPCFVPPKLPVLSPDPGNDGDSIGYTLLSVLSDYTLVRMWASASDEVEDALAEQTCSVGKRATYRRHASRHGVTTRDLEKRASDPCLHSTVAALLGSPKLVSMLVGLYRGNPIPGVALGVSQLPGYATSVMTNTFINGLSTASN